MVEEMKVEEIWNKRFDKVSYGVISSIDVDLKNTMVGGVGKTNSERSSKES